MVINLTTKQGVFGNSNGSFAITASPGDEIVLSAKKYVQHHLIVPAHPLNCRIDTTIYIQPKLEKLAAVTIHPLKTLAEIKEERKNLSKEDPRSVTGVDVLSSPITALYERFSKKGKEKRKVAELKHQDKMNQIVKELLRTYVSYDVIYLNEDQFDDFIHFLAIDDRYLKTVSDYDLIMYIQGRLEEYKKLHPKLFPKR